MRNFFSGTNWNGIHEGVVDFSIDLLCWLSLVLLAWILHLASIKFSLPAFDPSESALEIIRSVTSPKHLLFIISGPFTLWIFSFLLYLGVRRTCLKTYADRMFQRLQRNVGREVYHVLSLFMALLFVALFITDHRAWILFVIALMLFLLFFLLLVFTSK